MSLRRVVLTACVASIAFNAIGASYIWRTDDFGGGPNYAIPEDGTYEYYWAGVLTSDSNGKVFTGTSWLVGYLSGSSFYFKQLDHKTTPMPVDDPLFVVAYYGQVLCQDTFATAAQVPLVNYYDTTATGGVEITTPDDFYLGVMFFDTYGDGYRQEGGRTWYAWLRVSLGDDMSLRVIDSSSNASFEGGGITVGIPWADEPEPAGGLLAALGLAALLLRRRRFGRKIGSTANCRNPCTCEFNDNKGVAGKSSQPERANARAVGRLTGRIIDSLNSIR